MPEPGFRFCTWNGAPCAKAEGGEGPVAGQSALDPSNRCNCTRVAKHDFCKVCGIYTFHRPRVAPELWGVNVGCLEGVDPLALKTGLNDGAAYSAR